MSAHGDQIWVCQTCTNARRFGNGFPEDNMAICQLRCEYCMKATPHRFSHVDPEQIPARQFAKEAR